eukprot:3104653-Prorocentrum_lima.AAC.1
MPEDVKPSIQGHIEQTQAAIVLAQQAKKAAKPVPTQINTLGWKITSMGQKINKKQAQLLEKKKELEKLTLD